MKKYHVEVLQKQSLPDPRGQAVAKDAEELGCKSIGPVRVGRVYLIEGTLSNDEIFLIAAKLLTDPVSEEYTITEADSPFKKHENCKRMEVWFHACVTDTVGETVAIGIADLGITDVARVATGTSYIFNAAVPDNDITFLVQNLLANGLINTCRFN